MNEVCFVDVDGVLCDFVGGALRLFRREDLLSSWPPGEWSIAKLLGLTEGDFWAGIDRDFVFWETLRPTAEYQDIMEAVEKRFGDNVYLLTSPSLNPACLAGKARWIKSYLPAYYRKFFMGTAKHALAGPGRFLIDDYDKNVDDWRAAGGRALLLPRPWNRNRIPVEQVIPKIALL